MLKKVSYLLVFVLGFLCASSHAAETITYYHHDALGSAVAATDESGNLLWREDYRPYGERIRNPANTDNNLWYTGKPEEAQIGLQYFGARWYDPNLGRFTGMDPVGFNQGNIHSFNRYVYANNNPYVYLDPDGRTPAHVLYYGTLSTIELTTIVFGSIGATAALTEFGDWLYRSTHKRPAYLNEDASSDSSEGKDTKASAKDKKRKYTKKDRQRLYDNADGTCEYCDDDITMEPGTGKSMEGDHIDPWAGGGQTTDENGASACRDCNRSKGKKQLGTGEGQFNPSNPNTRIKDKMN